MVRLDAATVGFLTDLLFKLLMPVSSFDLAVFFKLPVAVVVVVLPPAVAPGAARRDAVFLTGGARVGEVIFSCVALTGLRTPVFVVLWADAAAAAALGALLLILLLLSSTAVVFLGFLIVNLLL